jgi:hypothetical protein
MFSGIRLPDDGAIWAETLVWQKNYLYNLIECILLDSNKHFQFSFNLSAK